MPDTKIDLNTTIPSLSALQSCQQQEQPLLALRELIVNGDTILNEAFKQGTDITELVHQRANMIDALLKHLWSEHFSGDCPPISLVAVGGYGRGELHPHSDVDIMLLIDGEDTKAYAGNIESFITLLWDLGLDIGHSVRSLNDVKEEAKKDVTVITNIMEARLLSGNERLFSEMQAISGEESLWNIQDFYTAKLAEQEGRYKKFDDHAYRLEPNIKDGPGGLRDIQNIGWVAKRYYGVRTLKEVTELGFLTEQESNQLLAGRALLWQIRWGLHLLVGRGENRLQFDLQRQLATLFGYVDDPEQQSLAVEQLMRDYYFTVIRLERLNEMLLQVLREAIFPVAQQSTIELNPRFVIRNNYLEVVDADTFVDSPSALLEVFQLMQKHHELEGVGAQTIRAIRQHRDLINEDFRKNKNNQDIFLSLMNQEIGVTREFRRMNRYGILARYIPEFGNLVGRMQFDMFHIYTVDQHTIAVLGNSRIFTVPEGKERFPKATEIYQRLAKPQLLHLGALFHDIGKGCGGDHSEIGEGIAARFCAEHGMSRIDSQFVQWLVKMHLQMSMTTQRMDISDPQVIQDFAEKMGDQEHLDILYLLTIADVNGTNPSLWTSWKAQLLSELYSRTSRALRRGAANPLDIKEIKQERIEKVLSILEYADVSETSILALLKDFPDDYFLRHSSDEVAWQTQAIVRATVHGTEGSLPLVVIKDRAKRGGTPIFIYSEETENLFSLASIALDRIGLSVVDARIITTLSGKTLDTFIVLEQDGNPVDDVERKQQISQALYSVLRNPDSVANISPQRIPRQLKQFDTPTRVTLNSSMDNKYTIVEIETTDRPGILAQIGKSFIDCNINVHNAKINTLGERVDDVFFITDCERAPLSELEHIEMLTDSLYNNIDADRENLSATNP